MRPPRALPTEDPGAPLFPPPHLLLLLYLLHSDDRLDHLRRRKDVQCRDDVDDDRVHAELLTDLYMADRVHMPDGLDVLRTDAKYQQVKVLHDTFGVKVEDPRGGVRGPLQSDFVSDSLRAY